MRLFAFAAALAAQKARSVHANIRATGENCVLHIMPPANVGTAVVVAAPRLIEPSADVVTAVARAAGARLDREDGALTLTLPRAQPE
jgi:hypothetical protein